MITGRREKGMGEYAKTVKIEKGTLGLRCREVGRSAGRLRAERVCETYREVSRSAGIGRPRGWRGCRQKCREVRNSAGRREAYGWHRSLAGCSSRKEAVNKAAQAPLVPMGAGLGHRLGSPQGRMGPRQLPTGRKILECGAEPLTYTLWERRGRDRQRQWGGGRGRQGETKEK